MQFRILINNNSRSRLDNKFFFQPYWFLAFFVSIIFINFMQQDVLNESGVIKQAKCIFIFQIGINVPINIRMISNHHQRTHSLSLALSLTTKVKTFFVRIISSKISIFIQIANIET
jgi:hypothetical protein